MSSNVKKLRIPDLIFNRPGTLTFRLILFVFGAAAKLFFRRIETVNADTVPKGTGVVFVSNHPNGLIDPLLVFIALPRRIAFLAKSTIFKMPVLSFLARTVEALPVYRKMDSGADVSKNDETFRLAAERLRGGGSIAIFPEGVSHNSPKLLPIKTGAARIALGALAAGEGKEPFDLRIVPVGLYYTNKTTFRSEALLYFGQAFTVEPSETDENGNPPHKVVKELTAQIEAAIRDVTLNAESEAELHIATIAEEIFSAASRENPNLGDKVDFKRRYVADEAKEERLIDKISVFDKKLEAIGLEPQHLSLARLPQGLVVKQAIFQTWVMVMLLPLSLFGAILHFPAYQLCKLTAYYFSRHDADDIASTVKVLAGLVFFPLTWIIAAATLYFLSGSWMLALASIPFCFACGYLALYSLEEATEMSGWAKAIWHFLTKKEKFLKLYAERKELSKKLRDFD